MTQYDIFLSYATEDREEVAFPLFEALKGLGLRVWLDASVLQVGDSLARSLDEGLARSSYAVVVLSPHYLGKHWTTYELRGLLAKEADGRKVILPIWHNLSRAEVETFSLPLADRLALVSSEAGIDEMALRIRDVVKPARSRKGSARETKPRKPRSVPVVAEEEAGGPGAPMKTAVDDRSGLEGAVSSRQYRSWGYHGARNTLSVGEAASLARSPEISLSLQGDLDLTPKAARELAEWPGEELKIWGFWDFSPEIARELAGWRGKRLSLYLDELEPDAARALAQWSGERLEISSLRSLDPAAAEHLASWPGAVLALPFLRILLPEAAQALSRWGGRELVLESLGKLPAEAARVLAQWQGSCIDLSHVQKLSFDSVEGLSHWRGTTLRLRYLHSLKPAVATCLAQWPGQELDLEGIRRIPTRAARSLYFWTGDRIRLSKSSTGRGAESYLHQWGDRQSKEADYTLKRKRHPARPEEFGIIPALMRVWQGRSGDEDKDIGRRVPAPRRTWSRGIQKRRHAAWRGVWVLGGSTVFLAGLVVALVVWFFGTSAADSLLDLLRIQEGPEMGWKEGVLAVPRFLGRLLLVLVPPVLLGAIFLFGMAFSELPLESLGRDGDDIQSLAENSFAAAGLLSSVLMLGALIRIVFPGFLSVESLIRSFSAAEPAAPAGFGDGLWHGFFNLPRALLVGWPPHASASTGWLFYLPGYLLGLCASAIACLMTPYPVLLVLVGFREKRVDQIMKSSNSEGWLVLVFYLYLLWCVILAVWTFIG
ncbi:MAG TPA: toll/interleukin-1 receptor domain-containing protein [Thermoanaerobaculia bacterium]|nr:toll/interleukin-1 receptor domain-containing protein [Thermoanaerobaculia bacterium]